MSWNHRKSRAAVVLVLVVVAAVVVFLSSAAFGGPAKSSSTSRTVSTLTAPGNTCTDPSLPGSAASVENDQRFTSLSGGLCYNFVGASDPSTARNGTTRVFTFDYYNGSVFYPCGNHPQEIVASRILAVVETNGSTMVVQGAKLANDSSQLNPTGVCGKDTPGIWVVRAELVEVTIPAVLEVNITLDARLTTVPVTNLRTVLEFPGANQTIVFSSVSPTSPLSSGRSVSQISIITGPLGFVSGGIYGMSIEGSFQGGQSFKYNVQVALVTS